MDSLLRDSSRNIGDQRQIREQRQNNIQESEKLFKKSGIDIIELRNLRERHNREVSKILQDLVGYSEEEASSAIKTDDRSEQLVLSHPYHEYFVESFGNCTKGPDSFGRHVNGDNTTGVMEHDSWIRIRDAGNREYACIHSLAQIGKLIKVPRISSLEIRAFLKNLKTESRGHWNDECGYSYLWIAQLILGKFKVTRVWPIGGTETKATVLTTALFPVRHSLRRR